MLRRHHQRACHKQSCDILASLFSIRLPDQPLPTARVAPSSIFDRDGAPSPVATGNIPFGPAGQEDSLGINPKRGKPVQPFPAVAHINPATSCRPNHSASISSDSPRSLRPTQLVRPRPEATVLGAMTAGCPHTDEDTTACQNYLSRIQKDFTTDPVYNLMRPGSPSSFRFCITEPPVASGQTHVAAGSFNAANGQQSPAPATTEATLTPVVQAQMSQHRRRCQSRDPPELFFLVAVPDKEGPHGNEPSSSHRTATQFLKRIRGRV